MMQHVDQKNLDVMSISYRHVKVPDIKSDIHSTVEIIHLYAIIASDIGSVLSIDDHQS